MNTLKTNLRQEHWETLSWGSTCHQLLTPWQLATLLVEAHPQWLVSCMSYFSHQAAQPALPASENALTALVRLYGQRHLKCFPEHSGDVFRTFHAGMISSRCPQRWRRGRWKRRPGALQPPRGRLSAPGQARAPAAPPPAQRGARPFRFPRVAAGTCAPRVPAWRLESLQGISVPT